VRRLAAIAVVLAAAAMAGALLLGSSAQGSSTTRFDVIFDDARGLIGGQLVKIAGARAGTINDVVVTPDFKARIEATVDSRFMPFHQDATCTIRPEGLIAENYVDCDPGTANSPPIQASGGHPPTVPVSNTTEPVSLLDLFNIFNLPTRQRFMVILDELGIGTAARGEDFNAILRRANPALAEARQVIAILARQRAQLATIVDATNTIAAQGAANTANVQNFLDRAAGLSTLTAAHHDPLSQAVARLPGLLAAAQPSLQQLDVVARDGTPVLQNIQAAVPELNRVNSDFRPFVAAARPALVALGQTLKKGIPAIRDTTPVVTQLRKYGDRSLPGTLLFARLSSNLQRRGFIESFLSVTYYVATALSRFDSTSHLLSILLTGPNNGTCGNYNPTPTPVPGCSAHFGSQPPYRPVHSAGRNGRAAPVAATAPSGSPGVTAAAPSTASSPRPVPAVKLVPVGPAASAVQQSAQTLQNLVNYLLR
jgi:ABC-type transporter Mla subunit MlaD